jgi:predicted ATPase
MSESLDSPSRKLINEMKSGQEIYKFVVTGGPCAGKTTAMERLQVYLRERGFRVFVVPEAATMLFINGASPDDLASEDCESAFQQFVIRTQTSLEDSMMNYAKSVKTKSVILCDRGVMDGSAYVTTEIWQKVLEKANMDIVSAREGRYDAVFHLVTAADGAEAFYSLANNKARHETVEEAIAQDRKTQKAWQGHPHHVIIDNRNKRAFERKMELFVSMLAGYVGLPSLNRRSHKYSLRGPVDFAALPADIDVQVFDVEKIMLEEGYGAVPTEGVAGVAARKPRSSSTGSGTGASVGSSVEDTSESNPPCDTPFDEAAEPEVPTGAGSDDVVLYSFIRRRSLGQFHAYGLTTVKRLPSGELVELKQVINSRMYAILSNSADPTREIVRQKRYCFQWERQSFHMYEYLSPKAGIWVLHCQSESDPIIPAFLPVEAELSKDDSKAYSSRHISLREQETLRRLSADTHTVFASLPK